MDPELAAIARDLRDQASGLRQQADRLVAHAERLEQEGAGDETILRGRDVAARLRELADVGTELHYGEWDARLRGAGFLAAGVDPRATVLTALSRSRDFEVVGVR